MTRPMLQVEALAAGYAGEKTIRDISFSLAKGDLVGLIGPNGSGKTTLLKACLRLLHTDSGSLRVDGKSMSALSRREIAKRITMVPQDTHVDFAFSVRELVAMGRYPHLGRFRTETGEDRAAISRAMSLTRVDAISDRPAVELSGGERQRVLIARALAQATPVILLDEPTSNLDLAHQVEVLQLIREITRENRCALAAIHDVSLASRFCDRLIVMRDGTIATQGRPEQVLSKKLFEELFHVRVDVIAHGATGSFLVVPIEPVRPRSNDNNPQHYGKEPSPADN